MVLGTRSYPFLLVLWISKIPSEHNIYITRVLIDRRMSHSTLRGRLNALYFTTASRWQGSQTTVAKKTYLLGGPLSSISNFSDRPFHAAVTLVWKNVRKGIEKDIHGKLLIYSTAFCSLACYFRNISLFS